MVLDLVREVRAAPVVSAVISARPAQAVTRRPVADVVAVVGPVAQAVRVADAAVPREASLAVASERRAGAAAVAHVAVAADAVVPADVLAAVPTA
jgi:hypothetical protein